MVTQFVVHSWGLWTLKLSSVQDPEGYKVNFVSRGYRSQCINGMKNALLYQMDRATEINIGLSINFNGQSLPDSVFSSGKWSSGSCMSKDIHPVHGEPR